MPEHPMHEHIRSAAESERCGLTARMFGECWPGGGNDRAEPAARAWLRLWHPARAAVAIPVCSCRVGHCAVCN